LLPRDALERAKVRAIAQIIACDIHPLNNVGPLRYLKNQMGQDQAKIDAWYHHWVLDGFDAIEAMLRPGPYAFGSEISLADVCLVPQIYNARRLKVPLDRFPKIVAVDAACGKLAAFEQARPENQSDADPSLVSHRNLVLVVLWMTGALLSFCLMAVAFRKLADSLSIMEILATRNGLGLAVMVTLLILRPELRPLVRSRRPGLTLFRNTIHLAAQYLWAMSVLLLPLATVFALEFSAPAWALLLAVPVLGERLTASRVGAVVLGLIGVLVILRPGLETFRPETLLVLAAAVGFAVTMITTKKLTMTDSTFAIIIWMNVIQLPLTLIPSDPLFVMKLSLGQLPAFAAVGVAGLASHYCLANAFRAGDASVVVPLDFLRIPLIAVIGWWLYGEALDALVFVGAGLIIVGVLWNLQSEARRQVILLADPQDPVAGDPRPGPR
jgi:drug/metabolite transporter (DMT)-like permease